MPEYLAPGVYINEIPRLPPSIKTAPSNIAVFIGYTERLELDSLSLLNIPTRISSLAEFKSCFGGDALHQFNITPVQRGQASDVTLATKGYCLTQCSANFLLYRSISLFFSNGGCECYVVSVGDYGTNITANSLLAGLRAIQQDVPASIVVMPDAVALDDQYDCTLVQQTLLTHCSQEPFKRFAILDIYQGYTATSRATSNDCIDVFCHNIGVNKLHYAAAYYPWLNTNMVRTSELNFANIRHVTELKTLLSMELALSYPKRDKKNQALHQQRQSLIHRVAEARTASFNQKQYDEQQKVHQLLLSASPFYSAIMTRMAEKLNLLPPSGAVCGVYVSIEATKGVWKAPANVSLSSVISPCQTINNQQQQELTITPSGKSINAIRGFSGKGVLVWGARTLAGNDNEWRYIHVRRTATMIEQSISEGLKGLAFEANNQTLWSKAQGMTENFLMQLWRAGALVGAKPDEAFFVNVGLNKTMTYTDIQQGRLIIQLGISMTRPAEFTILTIEQKIS
jgi:phage tail sheath protein FI